MKLDVPIIYLTVSVIITFFISIYAWKHPKTRSARAFSVACFTAILWMSGDVVGRLGTTHQEQWIGELVRYLGVVSLPVATLNFLSHYTNRPIKISTIRFLCIIPVVSWLMLATNPLHQLMFVETAYNPADSLSVKYGVYFWYVHLPYCYGLLLTGFTFVLIQLTRTSSYYRTQIILFLVSILIPFGVNVAGIFRLFGETALTPLSFPVFSFLMAIAIFRYRFLAGNPIAYETVFANMRDGVVIVDRDNTIMDINRSAANGLGKTPGEIVGMNFEKAFENWKEVIGKYANEKDFYDEIEINLAGAMRHLSVSITPLEGPDETLDGRIFTLRDITDRKQYQLSLETLAFHDPLTRLANRRKFDEEVERALETEEKFAVLYFDLNHFKRVNDTMGHETGDKLLQYVAARVASVLRKPDMLARLGGDEFAALLHGCDAEGMEIVLERMTDNVTRPFQVGENTLVADLSIGTAFYPSDGETLSDLLRFADAEMYRVKRGQRNPIPLENKIPSESSTDFVS